MKHIIFIFFSFLFFKSYSQTFTQVVITSDGGFHKQISGSLQYSIGEPLTETYSAGNNKYTQGFQQGEYTLVAFIDNEIEEITFQVFPNPVTNKITILFGENNLNKQYEIEIFDNIGKKVKSMKLGNQKENNIDISDLFRGMYYLRIYSYNDNYFKVYKLEKLQ